MISFSQPFQVFFPFEIEADDSDGAEREKMNKKMTVLTLCHIDAVRSRSRMKPESSGKNRPAKLIYPNKQNGTVWYLEVSIHTMGPLHLKGKHGGGGGGGASSESFHF